MSRSAEEKRQSPSDGVPSFGDEDASRQTEPAVSDDARTCAARTAPNDLAVPMAAEESDTEDPLTGYEPL